MKYRVVYRCETYYEAEIEADSFEDAEIEADAMDGSEFTEVASPFNSMWELDMIEDERGRRLEY